MKKLKAGSLTYAVFLSVVAAIICLLMITLAFGNRTFFLQSDVREKLKDNALSGIAFNMALPPGEEHSAWHDLYLEGDDSVYIKKRKWGAYEVASAYAKTGIQHDYKTAFLGYHSSQIEKTSLYLADRNRPLQLAGSALLEGECWIPKKGLDKAYIEGTHYSRQKLIYGEENPSKSQIPALLGQEENYWKSYFKKSYNAFDSLVYMGKIPQQINHPFHKKTLVFFSEETVQTAGLKLSGNIIILSTQKIEVSPNSYLNDVLLLAPKITVKEKFTGNLQAVARDTLLTEEKVKLTYPSSLTVLNGEKSYLQIASETEINGCVISHYYNTDRKLDLAIKIMPEAIINGFVHCLGNLQHNGKINGSLLCNAFLLKTPSGVYENHLLNGEINRKQLAKEFCGPAVENWDNQTYIIKWVY